MTFEAERRPIFLNKNNSYSPSYFVYDIFMQNAKDTLNSAKTLIATKHVSMITYSNTILCLNQVVEGVVVI